MRIVEELTAVARVRVAASASLGLLLRDGAAAHHRRPVRVRHAAQEVRGHREPVDELGHRSVPLLLLCLHVLLIHGRHFGRRQRADAVARRGGLVLRLGVGLGERRVRLGASLGRRVRRLNAPVAQVSVLRVSAHHAAQTRLPIERLLVEFGRRRPVDGGQFAIGARRLLARRSGGRRGGSSTGPFHLFAPPRPIFVVGVLLQVNHAQSLRLLDVRPPVLRSEGLPLFTCSSKVVLG